MSDGSNDPDIPPAEQFAVMRRALEEGVVALVHSLDGRVFNFRLPLTGDPPKAGDFVRLTTEGDVFLGQIVSSEVQLESSREVAYGVPYPSQSSSADQRLVARPTVRVVVGEGVILAAEADDYTPHSAPRPFANATISPAKSEDIAAYARGMRAKGGRLAVGRPRAP